MSKGKCLQIQTTGCDTQKRWIKLVLWSEVDIGNKHQDNTFCLDQTWDSKRKILLILALNFLFKIHQSWPDWLSVSAKYIPHTTETERELLESLKNSQVSMKLLWMNAVDKNFDKCISARERHITSTERRCFNKKQLFSGTQCLKDYKDSFVLFKNKSNVPSTDFFLVDIWHNFCINSGNNKAGISFNKYESTFPIFAKEIQEMWFISTPKNDQARRNSWINTGTFQTSVSSERHFHSWEKTQEWKICKNTKWLQTSSSSKTQFQCFTFSCKQFSCVFMHQTLHQAQSVSNHREMAMTP